MKKWKVFPPSFLRDFFGASAGIPTFARRDSRAVAFSMTGET